MPELLLALDAGTTGARAMLVDPAGRVLGMDKCGIETRYPGAGLVEQDGAAVWDTCRAVIAGALAAAGRSMADVAAIGVTTQRASVVLWDRAIGEPVCPILIWSDLRGMNVYKDLRAAGFASWPQVPSAKLPAAIALAGRPLESLRWGTLDSWLVFRLSGGAAHVTDSSCAWLSGYMDYDRGAGWNAGLLAYQSLPETLFPRLTDSWGAIAETTDGVPICAIMADQQAGMVAHDALRRGAWKATYGTSAVLMANAGGAPFSPDASMPAQALATIAGEAHYCIEGMVISAGSFVDWLCGPIGLFDTPAALESAARSVPDAGGVQVRPSLQGLGTPHGRFNDRGLISGLSFSTSPAHLARGALTGIACRIREIADLIAASLPVPDALPVDGGMAASDIFLQIQADMLQRPVRRHAVREGTAYGAAIAAGLGAGLIAESDLPALARYDADFTPAISRDAADHAFARWSAAITVQA
ncbi:FGGY family carbohydrate kinase [Sphingobium boeckii]|uniref:Glycerol kinase n=1 Tax=Sphingobium boeckii TaxID=1082345 RepID=A0A7W9AJJ3_9SPHN|nr:FGGY family carbohydrate kinase [Sphingobium boeckii]MBB5686607.1 glycerol kinase [Sphingobium boeckii]